MENYIISEVAADDLIMGIRKMQDEKKRFESIATQQIQAIKDRLEVKNQLLEDAVQFSKDQLRAFFLTVDKKQTKTQESYSMLSGKLIMKKPTIKIVHDDSKILKWASENAKEYVKETLTSKLDWSTFKKDLDIDNGMIVNKTTGEELSTIEGLSLEEVGEIFDIK